jgi:hypothetical protein
MTTDIISIHGYLGYTIDRAGVVQHNGKVSPQRLGRDGYYAMSLKNLTTGKWEPKRIKDLVAKAYLPKDNPRKKYLCFKDKNPKNHHLDNLIWMTEQEKTAHHAKPIDTSETRMCKKCEKLLPMTDFPLDHPNHDTGEGNRRHHCQKCITASKPPPTSEQKARKKDRDLKAKYNISLEEWNVMFKEQDGKCANTKCRVDISGERHSDTDHCHTTKKVRGLLCPLCNKAIGMVGDSVAKLEGLIQYLQKHEAVPTEVMMPVHRPRVKPPKKGEDHGNSGAVRSEKTREQISASKKAEGAKKYECLFADRLKEWIANPEGDKEKKWTYQISRKKREGTLPQNCLTMLDNTPGWIFPSGTPHSTDSRVQSLITPSPSTPLDTP